MLIKCFTTGPFETNGYLLPEEGIIIDAPPESAALFLAEGVPVHTLLLTHSHIDHIADAAILKKEFGLKIYVHEADVANLRTPGSDGIPLLFPVEGIEPDEFLGETIGLFSVIHTPGHSPGSVCFLAGDILFSGDTLFKRSIGNLSFPTSDPLHMKASLTTLVQLPSETKVYPGHGEPTTIGSEADIVQLFF